MQKKKAEQVEKMMPTWIQDDEQMNPKRMHHVCKLWNHELAKAYILNIFGFFAYGDYKSIRPEIIDL